MHLGYPARVSIEIANGTETANNLITTTVVSVKTPGGRRHALLQNGDKAGVCAEGFGAL